MITDIEDYFAKGCGRCERFATENCATRIWADGLTTLRRICRGAGLVETVKWGHPCYMHAGRNIAIIGAFRGDFRITFFNAALMRDALGLLERPGPNTRQACMIRMRDNAPVAATEAAILSYLYEAMGYAEAGVLPAATQADIDLPGELVDALDADADLAEAFHALTPGRQRSYVLHLSGAKTATTRIARIARLRDHILAGKGATER